VSAPSREELENDRLGSGPRQQCGAFNKGLSARDHQRAGQNDLRVAADREDLALDRQCARHNEVCAATHHDDLEVDHQRAGQNDVRAAADREDLALDHQCAGRIDVRVAAGREDLALDHQCAGQNEVRLATNREDLALDHERTDRGDMDSTRELSTAASCRNGAGVVSFESGHDRGGPNDEPLTSDGDPGGAERERVTARPKAVLTDSEDDVADRDWFDTTGESIDANGFWLRPEAERYAAVGAFDGAG
jgi:hypothetical protein